VCVAEMQGAFPMWYLIAGLFCGSIGCFEDHVHVSILVSFAEIYVSFAEIYVSFAEIYVSFAEICVCVAEIQGPCRTWYLIVGLFAAM